MSGVIPRLPFTISLMRWTGMPNLLAQTPVQRGKKHQANTSKFSSFGKSPYVVKGHLTCVAVEVRAGGFIVRLAGDVDVA